MENPSEFLLFEMNFFLTQSYHYVRIKKNLYRDSTFLYLRNDQGGETANRPQVRSPVRYLGLELIIQPHLKSFNLKS